MRRSSDIWACPGLVSRYLMGFLKDLTHRTSSATSSAMYVLADLPVMDALATRLTLAKLVNRQGRPVCRSSADLFDKFNH